MRWGYGCNAESCCCRCIRIHTMGSELTRPDGMLLPPLCTAPGYVAFAETAGLKVFAAPKDISQEVKKTWYVQTQHRALAGSCSLPSFLSCTKGATYIASRLRTQR